MIRFSGVVKCDKKGCVNTCEVEFDLYKLRGQLDGSEIHNQPELPEGWTGFEKQYKHLCPEHS